MKIIRLPVVALALVAACTTFVGANAEQASAQVVRVAVGPPGPPPGYVDVRGSRPGPRAVWIDGYRDWRGGSWFWVRGHWDYPPRPGLVWIPGHWRHGYWRPGHWR